MVDTDPPSVHRVHRAETEDNFQVGLLQPSGHTAATSQSIAQAVLSNIQDGSIILLHDNQPMNPHSTIAALDTLIPELQNRGYAIVTLTELFERKGVDPASKTHDMGTRVP